jgi:hypothetical protein
VNERHWGSGESKLVQRKDKIKARWSRPSRPAVRELQKSALATAALSQVQEDFKLYLSG